MAATDRDIQTAVNVLRKVAHRPEHEQAAVLREWFGKRATADFIARARQGLGGRASA